MESKWPLRTMLIGADRIQDKLRVVSQVDGPQFKMQDDPRLSTVGGSVLTPMLLAEGCEVVGLDSDRNCLEGTTE